MKKLFILFLFICSSLFAQNEIIRRIEFNDSLSSHRLTLHEVDSLLNLRRDITDSYSNTETDSLLNLKRNVSDSYSDTQIDSLLLLFYTKVQADSIKNLYYTKVQSDSIKALYYLSSIVDSLLNLKLDASVINSYSPTDSVYTKSQLNAGQMDNRYYTESEVNAIVGAKLDTTKATYAMRQVWTNKLYYNKKILWLGTSIPATGYPSLVGTGLGATVYNEASGSSMLRANKYDGNMIGVHYMNAMRSLTHTISDKRNLINNWEGGLTSQGIVNPDSSYGWRDLLIGTPPDTLTDADKKNILDSSFENKIIKKYLITSFADEFQTITPDTTKSGVYTLSGNYLNLDTWTSYIYNIDSNDIFYITTKISGVANSIALFYDSFNNVLGYVEHGINGEITMFYNKIIVPFQNAKKMIVSFWNAGGYTPIINKYNYPNKYETLTPDTIKNGAVYTLSGNILSLSTWTSYIYNIDSNDIFYIDTRISGAANAIALFYDSSGSVLGYTKETGTNSVIDTFVNKIVIPIGNAVKMVLSFWNAGGYTALVKRYNYQFVSEVDFIAIDHGHNDLVTTSYDLNDSTAILNTHNRNTFFGATEYLVDTIKAISPRMKFVFISHYENEKKPRITNAQDAVAGYYKYKYVKLYELLGWTQDEIFTTGYWSDATTWNDSGGARTSMTNTEIWMQDDLHPFSTITKQRIADIIIAELK